MKVSKKKVAAALGAGAIAAAGSGIALAYFTGGGSGTGTASVGSTATWDVAQDGSASGDMYPGYGTSTVTFTVTNNGNGFEGIDSASQVTPTVATVGGTDANAGDITSNGADVPGCLANWFHVALDTPTPAYGTSIDLSDSYSIPVKVTMDDATDTNQDACKSAAPDINLAVVASS